MNLESALSEFRKGLSSFSARATEMIRLALAQNTEKQFEVKADYVSDVDDVFHIHPTMIVARSAFHGSLDRGPEPYKSFPHFLQLPSFEYSQKAKSKSGVKTSTCPTTGAIQPAHVTCPTCDILH
jgi:hypothetical protein